MDDPVVLSFNAKNIITVNIMVALVAGAIILGAHALRSMMGQKTPAQDDAA